MLPRHFLVALLLLSSAGQVSASTIRAAVAANFKTTLDKLAAVYRARTGNTVEIVSASTGTLYTQIENGAPFDVFLAADSARPTRLEQSGKGIAGTRFTYAVGRLALLVPGSTNVDKSWLAAFSGRIAIANPATAPYGQAAVQALKAIDVKSYTLVVGTNVAQAFQFVDSGSVAAGLVSFSYIKNSSHATRSDYWLVPQQYYAPIAQQAIMVRNANPDAASLLKFLKSSQAIAIIVNDGYAATTEE